MKKIVVILVSLFAFMMTANSVQAQMRRVGVNSPYSKDHNAINKYRVNLPATGTSDDDYPAVDVAMPGCRVLTIGEIKALLPAMLKSAGCGDITESENEHKLEVNKAAFESKNKFLYVWVTVSISSNKDNAPGHKGERFYYLSYVWSQFDERGNIVKSKEEKYGKSYYAAK